MHCVGVWRREKARGSRTRGPYACPAERPSVSASPASSRDPGLLPLVSIVIPTYNSAEFLAEAIASARAQRDVRVEILINDDGSSDDTLAVAAAAGRADPRVRLTRNAANLGPAGNFRRCVALARGDFVKFLIPDDLLDADGVGRLLAPMLSDRKVVMTTSRRRLVDRDGLVLPDVPSSAPLAAHDATLVGGKVAERLLTRGLNLIGEPSTTLFRRDAVAPEDWFRYAGREYRVLADVSMWLTLCERGSIVWLAEPASSFRRHEGQDQRNVNLLIRGQFEWASLTEAACRRGLLTSRAARRRARFLARAAALRDAARRAVQLTSGLVRRS